MCGLQVVTNKRLIEILTSKEHQFRYTSLGDVYIFERGFKFDMLHAIYTVAISWEEVMNERLNL